MKQRLFFVVLFSAVVNILVNAGQGVMFYKAGFPDVAKQVLLADLQANANLQANAETCFYLGNTYFLQNKPDSAAYYFQQGVSISPEYPQNYLGQIMLKMKTQSIKDSESQIQALIKDKKAKKDISLYVAISYAYLYNNLTEDAMSYQQLAKNINPKNASVFVLLGDIIAPRNMGDACANYETALLYDANCVEAYIKYARLYRNANAKLSIEKLEQLQSRVPDFVLVDRELGDLYYSINSFDKAVTYYKKYIDSKNKTNADDLVKYAMALFMNHEFAQSLQVAQDGLKLSPSNPAFIRLVLYNNVDLKNYSEALKTANLLFSKENDLNISFLDYRYYGQALKETRQVALAVEEYKKAFKLDTTKIELWKDIADMYSSDTKYPEAISAFEKYKKSASSNPTELNISLGKLYYSYGTDTATIATVRKDALIKADSIFEKVALTNPDDYRGNFWRARVNSALDPETSLGSAKPYYEKTLAFAEAKKDARYNSILTECYSYFGWYMLVKKDYAASLDYWNKILAIDPNNPVAKKAITGIQIPKGGKK